jgi:hypothetical protein
MLLAVCLLAIGVYVLVIRTGEVLWCAAGLPHCGLASAGSRSWHETSGERDG